MHLISRASLPLCKPPSPGWENTLLSGLVPYAHTDNLLPFSLATSSSGLSLIFFQLCHTTVPSAVLASPSHIPLQIEGPRLLISSPGLSTKAPDRASCPGMELNIPCRASPPAAQPSPATASGLPGQDAARKSFRSSRLGCLMDGPPHCSGLCGITVETGTVISYYMYTMTQLLKLTQPRTICTVGLTFSPAL